MFKFLNHKTGKEEFFNCDIFNFIDRFTQHVPERYFRMIRYYGFLSNYHRGKLLPIVNKLFDREAPTSIKMTWRFLYKRTFGHSPTDCILCNAKLKLAFLCVGVNSFVLKSYHHLLAQNKPIRYQTGQLHLNFKFQVNCQANCFALLHPHILCHYATR